MSPGLDSVGLRIKALLISLVIVGLVAALYVAAERVKVESRNRAVELVIDYSEVAQLTATADKSALEVLRSLKQSGVTSAAVSEQTLRDLMDEGVVSPVPSQPGNDTVISVNGGKVNEDRVRSALATTLLPPCGCMHLMLYWKQPISNHIALGKRLPMQYLEQLPVGFSDEAVRDVKHSGMGVVARLLNYPGANPTSIRAGLRELRDTNVRTIVFQGDQVLGFKGAVEETAKAFEEYGLNFGRVEFAKQKGEQEIAVKAPANVIPVHSITQNEMPGLSETAIAERFQKAVRERGVRICYVRMFYSASDDLLRDNCDYIRGIARAIRAAGYELKPAHPMGEVAVPSWVRLVVALGVAAGAVLLLLRVVDLSSGAALGLTIAAVVASVGLASTGATGLKLVAFLSALVFPTLGALWAIRGAPESPTAVAKPLLRAWGRILGAVGISVVGGVLIVGLLSSREFMLRTNQFMGIKAAHLLPILALAGLFAGGIAYAAATWPQQRRRMAEAYGRISASPILIGQVIGLMAIVVLLALVVARSGNDAGLQVSSLELKFRAILDKVLFVRPRTKEFLIGYPLLLCGLAFLLRGRRQWGAVLVTIGSLGLVSALNTFCHIHTPLAVTALRVVNGVLVGSVLGVLLYRVIGRLPGREEK